MNEGQFLVLMLMLLAIVLMLLAIFLRLQGM